MAGQGKWLSPRVPAGRGLLRPTLPGVHAGTFTVLRLTRIVAGTPSPSRMQPEDRAPLTGLGFACAGVAAVGASDRCIYQWEHIAD